MAILPPYPGPLKAAILLLLLVAVALSLFYPPARPFAVPFLVGGVGGLFLRRIMPPEPERPLKPLSRGWQAVWWATVGLAVVAVFVEILRYFLPLLLIVIAWGYAMYRYRRMRGVQP